jgi:arsenate reductase
MALRRPSRCITVESSCPARLRISSYRALPGGHLSDARKVLFVCLHGSAKSVIAAEFAERLAAERGIPLEAASAGVEPDVEIPPPVSASLLADRIDVRDRKPVAVTEKMIRDAAHVVSFGCDLTGLIPAGVPVTEWADVPAVSEGYTTARDEIVRRLNVLLDEIARSASVR